MMDYDVGKQFEVLQAKLDFLVACEQERQKGKAKAVEKPAVAPEPALEEEPETEVEEEDIFKEAEEEPVKEIKKRATGPRTLSKAAPKGGRWGNV